MNCRNCNSTRIANVNAKASDLFFVSIGDKEEDGYLPRDMGIGGGDYLKMSYCLDCGQIQGKFPLPKVELEEKEVPKWAIRHIDKDEFWSLERQKWVSYSNCSKITNSDKELYDPPAWGEYVSISEI